MTHIKNFLSNSAINIRGSRSKRKILVFESDDWGSIRMPNNNVKLILENAGISTSKSAYCMFDSLESNTDLEMLFDILLRFKDINGNHPVITANTVIANPDFKKIENSKFLEYHFEPFTYTLQKYPKHDKVFSYYKLGISEGIFFPQFHGREHVNVEMWLDLLKAGNPNFKLAFNNNMWGLSNDVFPNLPKSIQATFDSNNNHFLKESIQSGLALFKEIFGYKSESFIANNFIWSNNLNNILFQNGVKYLQGMKYQITPKNGDKKRKLIRHYLGETNIYGQIHLIRNCSFEPSIDNNSFRKTINEIQNAFFWRKPAIIGTHRLNYIGSLVEENRSKNLKEFTNLLNAILKKWPDIEFMSSCQLGNLIKNNYND
jgi:hypothetical protein